MKSMFWRKFSALPTMEGKSDSQIARELKVSPNTIGGWRKHGVLPDHATFEKIETATGKPQTWFLNEDEFISVPEYAQRFSMGGGELPEAEKVKRFYQFRSDWLRGIASSTGQVGLSFVTGDSMRPSLESGDVVLIDRGRCRPIKKDGLYAIREDNRLMVKRLRVLKDDQRILVVSDNQQLKPDGKPRYPSYEVREEDLAVIGRVIWSARTWV